MGVMFGDPRLPRLTQKVIAPHLRDDVDDAVAEKKVDTSEVSGESPIKVVRE